MSWRQTKGSDAGLLSLEACSAAAINSSAASNASCPFQSSCTRAYKLISTGLQEAWGVLSPALLAVLICYELAWYLEFVVMYVECI